MKRGSLLSLIFCVVIATTPAQQLHADGILDEPVPWSGSLRIERIEKDLAEKGWRLSGHVTLRYSGENSILLVNGTEEDIATVSRYFGVK